MSYDSSRLIDVACISFSSTDHAHLAGLQARHRQTVLAQFAVRPLLSLVLQSSSCCPHAPLTHLALRLGHPLAQHAALLKGYSNPESALCYVQLVKHCYIHCCSPTAEKLMRKGGTVAVATVRGCTAVHTARPKLAGSHTDSGGPSPRWPSLKPAPAKARRSCKWHHVATVHSFLDASSRCHAR